MWTGGKSIQGKGKGTGCNCKGKGKEGQGQRERKLTRNVEREGRKPFRLFGQVLPVWRPRASSCTVRHAFHTGNPDGCDHGGERGELEHFAVGCVTRRRFLAQRRVVVERRRLGRVFMAGLVLDVRHQSLPGSVADGNDDTNPQDPGGIFHRARFVQPHRHQRGSTWWKANSSLLRRGPDKPGNFRIGKSASKSTRRPRSSATSKL